MIIYYVEADSIQPIPLKGTRCENGEDASAQIEDNRNRLITSNEPKQALVIHGFLVATPVPVCLSTPTLGIIAPRAVSW